MNQTLVKRYVELQALLITPIAPHWADYIWQEVLHHPTTIQNALWPTVPAPSPSLSAARDYVRSTSSAITSAEAAQLKRKDKGKATSYDPKLPKKLTIFCASSYPAWQDKYLDLLREEFAKTKLSNEKELIQKVGKMGEVKKAMPFVQGLRKRIIGGEQIDVVVERKLGFDEEATLREMVPGLRRITGCKTVEVVSVDEGGKSGKVIVAEDGMEEKREGLPVSAEGAVPGAPGFYFENVKG
jgi:leucyl-tRNA synthetase